MIPANLAVEQGVGGVVEIRSSWGSARAASGGEALEPGDVVSTRANARAVVEHEGGAVTRLERDSSLVVDGDCLELRSGAVWVRPPSGGGDRGPVTLRVPGGRVEARAGALAAFVERDLRAMVVCTDGQAEVFPAAATEVKLSALEGIEVSAEGSATEVIASSEQELRGDPWMARNLDLDRQEAQAEELSEVDPAPSLVTTRPAEPVASTERAVRGPRRRWPRQLWWVALAAWLLVAIAAFAAVRGSKPSRPVLDRPATTTTAQPVTTAQPATTGAEMASPTLPSLTGPERESRSAPRLDPGYTLAERLCHRNEGGALNFAGTITNTSTANRTFTVFTAFTDGTGAVLASGRADVPAVRAGAKKEWRVSADAGPWTGGTSRIACKITEVRSVPA